MKHKQSRRRPDAPRGAEVCICPGDREAAHLPPYKPRGGAGPRVGHYVENLDALLIKQLLFRRELREQLTAGRAKAAAKTASGSQEL